MGTFFYFAAEPNKVFDQKIFAANDFLRDVLMKDDLI
jgi:hypothetical protein